MDKFKVGDYIETKVEFWPYTIIARVVSIDFNRYTVDWPVIHGYEEGVEQFALYKYIAHEQYKLSKAAAVLFGGSNER